jgi:hypothetical protein
MMRPDSMCGSWLMIAKRIVAESVAPMRFAARLILALSSESNRIGSG